MTLTRLTSAQIIASVRKGLGDGYTQATAERVKSIAARTDDVEMLRALVDALGDALITPPKRPAHRAKKRPLVSHGGVIKLDEFPPMTKKERAEWLRDFAQTMGVVYDIHDKHEKGANLRTLCELHGIGVDTYYKWFPVRS